LSPKPRKVGGGRARQVGGGSSAYVVVEVVARPAPRASGLRAAQKMFEEERRPVHQR